MKSFWICALLVASIGVYTYAQEPEDYEDYYNYDNLEDLEKKIDDEINKINEKTDIENDLKVDEGIQQFKEASDNVLDAVDEPKDTIDSIDDYQFEDNRDKPKEEENDDKKDNFDNYGSIEVNNKEPVKAPENNDYSVENRLEPDDKNAPSRNEDYALLWGDDSIAPLPVPVTTNDDIKSIVEETQKILEEKDADNFDEEIKKEIGKVDIKTDDQPDLGKIVEETKKLLAESDDSFGNDEPNVLDEKTKEITNVDTEKKDDDQNVENKNEVSEEDTVDKVYADLNADLDKLFETLDKLKDDTSYEDSAKNIDSNLEETDDILKDHKENVDDDNMEDSEELVEDIKDDDDVDLDKILENILSEDDMKADVPAAEQLEPLINDALNQPNPDDAIEKDVESLDSKLEPILYLNDALVAESKESHEALAVKEQDVEALENNDENVDTNASVEKESEVKTTSIDDLTSAEMQDLVSQFSILHSEDLDVHSKSFAKDVAPVHITLKLDEPTIITSPGYPNPYPTNNIVDWILEGEGVGIELNITEFAVNGALGDYLLIKPGGVDESGHDGLLFTYRLNSERRYRFTDVDRLFMRFESKLGMMFFRGFVISAKMIAPIPEGPEPIPEPEAVISPPHSTTTLTLAMEVPFFMDIKDQFKQLLADMAEEYIKDNSIDPGLNTTSEVTQITKVGLCPISWPEYESCTSVTFGVSLMYDSDDDDGDEDHRLNVTDLENMWSTYSKREPFDLKLINLGISEFDAPDNSALTMWLLITGGVIIAMALLSFVLWKYSCSEDYSRMKTYSDTDSIQTEKRNIDLYPTPHQTLPPLYAESEYKWHEDDSTRVDMGGFANRSYARETMYDFESDEEVVATRDRLGAVTAKDSYGSNV